MAESTSAKGPATGYLYQAYYSLLALLEAEPGSSVALERLEDVDLYDGNDSTQLLQLKHKLKPGGLLSDSSVDFIKTLANWSQKLLSGDLDPDTTVLKLLTTQEVKPNSIPSYLVKETRDVHAACQSLSSFLSSNSGATIEPYVKSLRELTSDQLRALLSMSEVVGRQPHINEIEAKLRKSVGILVQPRFLNEVIEALLGAWIQEVKRQLTSRDVSQVNQQWVHEIARYYASFYRDESLPIYSTIDPGASDIVSLDERRFVSQLKKLEINVARLRTYKEDYFRASHHISKWSRDHLVSGIFVENYYKKLEREWREVLLTLVDELDLDTDNERRAFGKKLLKKVMLERVPNIKKNVDEPFIGRGCYHILADEDDRLFWHPDFEEGLLEKYLSDESHEGVA
tara:strand:- start:2737 stop:3933 length:1197 start_codon:yes stop_codon:yes gene_type:complete